jgi:glycosyltransferase involved in cell wall biosynthesis
MTADTVGGVWTYAMELAGSLSECGIGIALATMGAPLSSSQRRQAEAIPRMSIHESRYRLEWMDDPWTDVDAAGEWLLDLSRRQKVHLVHLNGYAHADLPWPVPVVTVAHSCVLSWWQAVKGRPAPLTYNIYRERVSRGLRASDLIVLPSAAFRDAFCRCWAVEPDKLVVIRNGRSPLHFSPGPKEPMIFAAGRIWDEGKNLHLLENKEIDEWAVWIAGESSHPDCLARAAAHVRFTGRLSPLRVARYLSRASIFASPSLYEPFGLSVLEAALSGCALVLSDIPTMRELWADAAYLVPPNDGDAWRDAFRTLIHDADLREYLGVRARRRASHYSPDRMAAGYLAAYETLMQGASRSCVQELICQ